MFAPKRTVEQWVAYLEMPGQQLTLDEFAALSLLHLRENTLQARQATEHVEGMIGAIDQAVAQIAPRVGIEYAASSTMRALLDKERDEARALATARRHNGTPRE